MYLMCIPENIHPPRRQRKFREVGGGGPKEVISKRVEGGFLIMEIPGGGGDMTSSPEIGGGSKTKVPLGLDSFWNYTKVIIKDYGLHFDLVD